MISAKTDWKSNGSKWGWESNSDQDLFFLLVWLLWLKPSVKQQPLRDRPRLKLISRHCVDLLSKKHNSPITTNRCSYFTASLKTPLLPPKLCSGFFWLYVNSSVEMYTSPDNLTCEWLHPLTQRLHFLLVVHQKGHFFFCFGLFLNSSVVILQKANYVRGLDPKGPNFRGFTPVLFL